MGESQQTTLRASDRPPASVEAGELPRGTTLDRYVIPSYSPTCNKANDYLAGVDMTALATAFSTNTPAASLNAGIYGGSATTLGNGIGHGEVFGLGAVGGNIIGFSRSQSVDGGSEPPALWAIDSTAAGGGGKMIPGSFSFTDGWSGAGVTTKVTVTVSQPPPPPPPK